MATNDPKCPRGDCIHYATSPGESPCRSCTCNRFGTGCRTFCYAAKPATMILLNETRCVCCGASIPEGRQICPRCEKGDAT